MPRDLRHYFWEIERAINSVSAFVGDRDFSAYDRDELVQAAVERKFIIIGEALRQATQRFPDEIASLGFFTSLTGFQSFLTVDYLLVESRTVWGAVQLLPELRTKVAARRAELDASSSR